MTYIFRSSRVVQRQTTRSMGGVRMARMEGHGEGQVQQFLAMRTSLLLLFSVQYQFR